jgi:hypothetical protein
MFNDMSKWIKTTTDVGIALLGLAIIVQILFGGSVPFFSGSVINSIASVISNLGAQGLVGLLVVWLVYAIFTRPVGQK